MIISPYKKLSSRTKSVNLIFIRIKRII